MADKVALEISFLQTIFVYGDNITTTPVRKDDTALSSRY